VTVRSAIPFICPECVGKNFLFGAFPEILPSMPVQRDVFVMNAKIMYDFAPERAEGYCIAEQ
jgi:hypothetical protein